MRAARGAKQPVRDSVPRPRSLQGGQRSFGHSAGDDLLCEVATQRMRNVVTTTLSRASAATSSRSYAAGKPHRPTPGHSLIGDLRGGEFVIAGSRVGIGVSIGIAVYPSHGDDAHMLLRTRTPRFPRQRRKPEARSGCSTRMLRRAYASGKPARSSSALAPKGRSSSCTISLRSTRRPGRPKALEALLRWPHPERGLIPPATFIPIAEESRLIGQLGLWVLREACREAASWTHPTRHRHQRIAAAVPNGDLSKRCTHALLHTGLPGNRLEIEITENVLIGDFSRR